MMIDINYDRSENVRYDYADYLVYVRKGMLSTFPNYAAESHWHDDIELIVVLSGHMLYNVNGEIIHMGEGEGIFVNARQLHFGYSDDKTECIFLCILFHPVLLCASKMFEEKFVMPVIKGGASYLHLSPEVDWQKRLLQYTGDIYDYNHEETAPLITQGAINLLWSEIVSHTISKNQFERANDARLTILKEMMAYIREHYTEKIKLEEIAALGHVSKRTCGNIFLQYLNQTPIGYLTDYRLRKSIELMKNTDMTILEISLATGFSGASYYAETFRKHFGKSPAEYRRMQPIVAG